MNKLQPCRLWFSIQFNKQALGYDGVCPKSGHGDAVFLSKSSSAGAWRGSHGLWAEAERHSVSGEPQRRVLPGVEQGVKSKPKNTSQKKRGLPVTVREGPCQPAWEARNCHAQTLFVQLPDELEESQVGGVSMKGAGQVWGWTSLDQLAKGIYAKPRSFNWAPSSAVQTQEKGVHWATPQKGWWTDQGGAPGGPHLLLTWLSFLHWGAPTLKTPPTLSLNESPLVQNNLGKYFANLWWK